VADQLVSLGLTEIAQEMAGEPSLFTRRSAVAAETDGFTYEPDLIGSSVTLGREVTPDEIVAARREARAGRPQRLFEIFQEMSRFGPGPQLSKARLAVTSARISFLPPEEFRGDAEKTPDGRLALEIAQAVEAQFRPHMIDALDAAFEKFPYGLVGLHVVTEARAAEKGREKVVRIEEIPGRRFELDPVSQAWRYRPYANRIDSVPVQPFLESGNIVLLESGKGSVPLDQRGLLFQCLIVWGLATYGLRWLARLAELCGIPFRFANYDPAKKGQKEIVKDALRRMGAAGWAALPAGVKVELINALTNSAGAGEIHERLIRIGAQTYDQVFHGHSQASNVEVGAGSRTSTEEASAQSRELHASRCVELASDFRAGLIEPYVRRNWGKEAAARFTPVLSIEPLERKDPEKVSKVALNLSNAGVDVIDKEDLVLQCGLKVAKDPAKALLPRSAAPTAPAGEKLARVLAFPARLEEEEEAPPVLGADGAPDAIGEELLAPYRAIFVSAIRDGAAPLAALSRVIQRAQKRPGAKVLTDRLASVLVASTGHGIEEMRDARGDR
jgi:phage gp29-like protein